MGRERERERGERGERRGRRERAEERKREILVNIHKESFI